MTVDDSAALAAASPQAQCKLAVILSGLGLVADGYNIMVVNLVRPNLEGEYGKLSAARDAAITAASLVGAIIGQIMFGFIADRYGRRIVFVITAALICIFSGLCAVVQPDILGFSIYTWLGVFRFFMGLGIGGEYPLAAASTAENVTPEQSTRALVSVFAGMACGLILGPSVILVLGSSLLDLKIDTVWRAAFGLGGAMAGVVAVLRYQHLQETPSFKSSATSASSESETHPSPTQGSMAALWSMRWTLAGTAGSWFLYDIVTYGVGLFSTLIFPTDAGYDTAMTTLKINTVSLFGTVLAIIVAPSVQMKSLQMWGTGIMACCFLLLMAFGGGQLGEKSGAHSVLCLSLFGLMRAADNAGPGVSTFTIPGQVYPTRVRGTAHGISAACGKLGAVVGTVAFPFMVESDSMEFIMAVMAAVCIATYLWTFIFVPAYGVPHLCQLAAQDKSGRSVEEKAFAAERLLYMDPALSEADLAQGMPLAASGKMYS